MNKKRVIHLIQALDNGGCENMLLRTLPLMTDFEHIIITLKKRGDLANKFEDKGLNVINIRQNNLFDIFAYKRLGGEITKNKPDIVITYLFHADLIGRLFLQPLFSSVSIISFLRTTYNHKIYWSARLFEKLSKNLVPHYLANSESVKEFYEKEIGVPEGKITVIPNGIDVKYFETIKRDEKFRQSLGIADDETVLICVANLLINKGHKYLLEAFEDVYKKNKKIKLLIVGDGTEKANLLNQIDLYNSKEKILFLGKRDDVPKLLKISDIFILSTLFEGMSNAVMEAMVCGLPIITTDIPENRILLNKSSALFVTTKSSSEIAKNIKLFLDDIKLADKLGKNAKQIILDNYDLLKVANKYEGFIRKLLSK